MIPLFVLLSLSPIKSQGDYGLCWDFSSIAMMENDDGSDKNLSELATFFESNNINSIFNATFSGNYEMAANTLMTYGAVDEYLLPYNSLRSFKGLQNYRVMQLLNVYQIPASDIKAEVLKHRMVGIYYYNDSKNYYAPTNTYYSGQKHKQNHAVTIVGWDDDRQCWLCRNSHGSNDYCYEGYFWMPYDEPSIAEDIYVFDSGEPYTNTYSNDNVDISLVRKYQNTISATFNSTQDETLEAISFAVDSSDVTYTINGTQTGYLYYPGYYTIPLNETQDLFAGQSFTVTISFDGGAWVPLDTDRNYRIKAQTSFETNSVKAPTKVKIKSGKKCIKLSWKKSKGATKYLIYRKLESDPWEYYGATTKTNFKDKDVAKGFKFKYYIVAINEHNYSKKSKVVSIVYPKGGA